MKPLRICFVATTAYPALVDRPDLPQAGGAEIQQVRLARELQRRGHEIIFITEDHGQPAESVCEGIRVLRSYRASAGLPRLRLLHPRTTRLWRAMRRADADLYYQRMGEWTTGVVAAFCRWSRRPFIFALASDFTCRLPLTTLRTWHERFLYRYGLRHADRVIAQTVRQQQLIAQNFQVASTVIPNCGPHDNAGQNTEVISSITPPRRVLWVGRFGPEKRLEMLLDVAESCPALQFDIVGDEQGAGRLAGSCRRPPRTLPNVHMHGRVPYREMAGFYRAAGALLCTSTMEGFPNTFLEAWSLGRPVISTVDLDGEIAACGLGVIAHDAPSLAAALRRLLLEEPGEWHAASQRCRAYYEARFTPRIVVDRLEALFAEVLAERR